MSAPEDLLERIRLRLDPLPEGFGGDDDRFALGGLLLSFGVFGGLACRALGFVYAMITLQIFVGIGLFVLLVIVAVPPTMFLIGSKI